MTDRLLRCLGVLVATAGVAVGFVITAFFAPVYIGSMPIPIAIVAEFVINAVALYFAYVVSEAKAPLVIPGAVWLVLAAFLVTERTEGDLVLYNGWVSLGVLIAGAAGLTVAAMQIITVDASPPGSPLPRPFRWLTGQSRRP